MAGRLNRQLELFTRALGGMRARYVLTYSVRAQTSRDGTKIQVARGTRRRRDLGPGYHGASDQLEAHRDLHSSFTARDERRHEQPNGTAGDFVNSHSPADQRIDGYTGAGADRANTEHRPDIVAAVLPRFGQRAQEEPGGHGSARANQGAVDQGIRTHSFDTSDICRWKASALAARSRGDDVAREADYL